MSSSDDYTIVRLRVPPELKQRIEEAAEKNNRSQSAEMVDRLERSYLTDFFRITFFNDLKEPAASIEIGPITFGLFQSQYKEIELYEMSLNSWILSYHAVRCYLTNETAQQLISLGCTYKGSSIRKL